MDSFWRQNFKVIRLYIIMFDTILSVHCDPNTFTKSICTHYTCFEILVCEPEKRSKIWVAKIGVQKTGSLLFKKRREEAA